MGETENRTESDTGRELHPWRLSQGEACSQHRVEGEERSHSGPSVAFPPMALASQERAQHWSPFLPFSSPVGAQDQNLAAVTEGTF